MLILSSTFKQNKYLHCSTLKGSFLSRLCSKLEYPKDCKTLTKALYKFFCCKMLRSSSSRLYRFLMSETAVCSATEMWPLWNISSAISWGSKWIKSKAKFFRRNLSVTVSLRLPKTVPLKKKQKPWYNIHRCSF